MVIDLDPTQTLAMAMVVLAIGGLLLERIAFLRNNNIPVPVVGGILFALVTTLLYARFNMQFSFDMSLKDPMMLTFFTTIGLTADGHSLRRGPNFGPFIEPALGPDVMKGKLPEG